MVELINFPSEEVKIESGISDMFNFDNPISVNYDSSNVDTTEKKKRGRPKKKQISDGSVMIQDDELKMTQSNEPYINTFDETNTMLKGAIAQIDIMQGQISTDIDKIRSSNTIRKKYDYITEMVGTSSQLINTKVSAIRELNKTITDCHKLEIQRIKDLKLTEKNETNDDKYIMDMYNAFIHTPAGSYSAPTLPSPVDITANNPTAIGTNIMGSDNNYGYNDYLNNLTPGQQTMRYESNENIKTVVVYDASTGYRYFATMDMSTGTYLNDTNLPDPMFVEDLTISVKQGTAYNSNLGLSYPLIVINNDNSALNEF